MLVLPLRTNSESEEARERKRFLQGGRSANRVVDRELERANVRLERQDAVAGSASLLGWRLQAYLCPQRSGKRPAAFVSGTARIGMEIIFADGAGWRWFVSLGSHVVAGRRSLRLRSQRRPHTVFVLGGYRCCRCQRRECPREQDQQQESGGQVSHS